MTRQLYRVPQVLSGNFPADLRSEVVLACSGPSIDVATGTPVFSTAHTSQIGHDHHSLPVDRSNVLEHQNPGVADIGQEQGNSSEAGPGKCQRISTDITHSYLTNLVDFTGAMPPGPIYTATANALHEAATTPASTNGQEKNMGRNPSQDQVNVPLRDIPTGTKH